MKDTSPFPLFSQGEEKISWFFIFSYFAFFQVFYFMLKNDITS